MVGLNRILSSNGGDPLLNRLAKDYYTDSKKPVKSPLVKLEELKEAGMSEEGLGLVESYRNG